jgi:hypothetical protein
MFTSKMPLRKTAFKHILPTCKKAILFKYERKVFVIVQSNDSFYSLLKALTGLVMAVLMA